MDRDRSRPISSFPTSSRQPLEKPKGRKKVSSACLACKTRRSRCSGQDPCGNCVRNNTECSYAANQDKRRGIQIKERLERLEEDRDLLIRFVTALREGGDRQALQLVSLIRSKASLDEIKVYLNEHMRVNQQTSPELLDVERQLSRMQEFESQRSSILDSNTLAVAPRWRVPARPWTKVTDNDNLVSHLLSSWFTWHHPYWIDRDRFIEDMQTRDPKQTKYCSPFLTNIILADACAYMGYPETLAEMSDIPTRTHRFYGEAKRLYEQEEGNVTLTTMQGLGVLWTCASLLRKERNGWNYQGQLTYTIQQFILLVNSGKASHYEPKAVDTSVWGLFNIITMSSVSQQGLPMIKPPRRPYPTAPLTYEEEYHDTWYPYPAQTSHVQAHTIHLLTALANLNQIACDISVAFYDDHDGLTRKSFPMVFETAQRLHTRINEWQMSLIPCLRWESCNSPHLLNLHMYYNAIIIILLGLIETKAKEEFLHPETYRNAQQLRIVSAIRISQLLGVHRASWGISHISGNNIKWTTISQETLLEHLDDPTNREAFISLCTIAKSFARRWAYGEEMLRSVQATASHLGISLPCETHVLFEDK